MFKMIKFELYLYGKKFILETDHKPLTYLAQPKHMCGCLMRWSLFPHEYNINIPNIPGKLNAIADYLSCLNITWTEM